VKYSFLSDSRDSGFFLKILVQPRAKKTEIIGIQGDRLKIKISSPPVDNKANRELIKFLGKFLGLKNKDLVLVKGETSREKTILIKAQNKEWLGRLKAFLE